MFRHHLNLLLPSDLPSISFINQSDIHNYNTRHVSDLHIAPTNTKLAGNTITTQGPIIWNNMNAALKNFESLATFKTCLKKYILDQYSSEIYNNMHGSIVWSFTVLYATTVLNVLSHAVLHPNLNLIWFLFSVFHCCCCFFSSGTEFPILNSLLLSTDNHDLCLMVFFTLCVLLRSDICSCILTALLEYNSLLIFSICHFYTCTYSFILVQIYLLSYNYIMLLILYTM